MSLVLILFGTALVSLALFNKVPRYVAPSRPTTGRGAAPARGGTATRRAATGPRAGVRPRVRLVSARLTEQGRALCTAVGGSALIVAFFLTLSGL
ncbi:hypothetical protein KIK06_00640 [Nocardiopsis sp. EMB25]|uniref:hypothetical protein n=1 Tax=Nocardiopsis sp. EMB25 TaxID=2835867 RepID=UPI002284F2F5|nr:hypothetical protein [Nocardiopsis sp. EMB25]MCY9782395.1 hypothetical protein [Nocardiopsis sp. EMB25]